MYLRELYVVYVSLAQIKRSFNMINTLDSENIFLYLLSSLSLDNSYNRRSEQSESENTTLKSGMKCGKTIVFFLRFSI